jgi:hypothetical protein
MVTTGSEPLSQAEVSALFVVLQDRFVALHNSAGRSCVVRKPSSAALAEVTTKRQLEALALSLTRPLPDSVASRAIA